MDVRTDNRQIFTNPVCMNACVNVCFWPRTTARWCTTLGSLTLTEMELGTAVIIVRLKATPCRQTPMTTERETPAASTLMEMVGAQSSLSVC